MQYTVCGIRPATMERYLKHVEAASPREAESQVQQLENKDQVGPAIFVSNVFEGHLASVDTYAQFVDPDRQP